MTLLTPDMIQFVDMVEQSVDFMCYDLGALRTRRRGHRLQFGGDRRSVGLRCIGTDTGGRRRGVDRRVVSHRGFRRWRPSWLGGLRAMRAWNMLIHEVLT